MNLKRLFLYLLIGSVAVSAVVGIGVILFGDFGNLEVRILMTTLTVTATSVLGLACGAYYETGRGRLLPIAGIAFTVAAALMTFLIIWDVLDDSKIFVKSAVTMMMLAVSTSHLSLLSMARLDRRFAWSRIAAFTFVSLLVGILLFLMWFEPEGDSDIVSRTIGVLSILVASVTVITPVFHKLSGSEPKIADIDAEIEELKRRIDDLEKQRSTLTADHENE
jgi:hypothetical protein